MNPLHLRLRICLGLATLFPAFAVGHGGEGKLPFAITLLPHGRTFQSLAALEFTIREQPDTVNGVPIRSSEFEIRSTPQGVCIARLPWKYEMSRKAKDERSQRKQGWAGRLDSDDLRCVGELAPGEYHMAFLLNGKRSSNVVAFRIDPKFDPVKAPTFELGVLEPHPLGKRSVPILWVIGPTPVDRRISNIAVALTGLNVDGVQLAEISGWAGPVGLIYSGDRFFSVPGLERASPPVEVDKPHTFGFTLAVRSAKPLWLDPSAAPLADAWDKTQPRPRKESPAIVRGKVLDAKGQPAVGYTVWLQTPVQTAAEEVTDAEGRYVFSGSLRPGAYRLCVAKDRSKPAKFRLAFPFATNTDAVRDFDFRHPAKDESAPLSDQQREALLVARHGHAEEIALLARRGVDFNFSDEDGKTPLMWAAGGGHAETVRALLRERAEVNASNQDGFTALYLAASGQPRQPDFLGVIQALLKAGAKPGAVTVLGETPFGRAAKLEHIETMRLLAEAGVDLRGEEGRSAMMIAIRDKRYAVLAELLKLGANPNQIIARQTAAIFYALNDPITVQIITDAKADVNLTKPEFNNEITPLLAAAGQGRADVMKLLLEAGADVNYRDLGGRTALDAAVEAGRPEVENLLRAVGGKEGEAKTGSRTEK